MSKLVVVEGHNVPTVSREVHSKECGTQKKNKENPSSSSREIFSTIIIKANIVEDSFLWRPNLGATNDMFNKDLFKKKNLQKKKIHYVEKLIAT